MEALQKRKSPPATYNLDMNLIGDYWGWFGKRSYHHTGEGGGPVAAAVALEACGELEACRGRVAAAVGYAEGMRRSGMQEMGGDWGGMR